MAAAAGTDAGLPLKPLMAPPIANLWLRRSPASAAAVRTHKTHATTRTDARSRPELPVPTAQSRAWLPAAAAEVEMNEGVLTIGLTHPPDALQLE